MNNEADTALARQWPEARDYKKSIRFEFSLYVSGIIVVLMLVTGVVITNRYVAGVTRSVVEKLLVQSRAYSGPAGKLIIASETPDALLLTSICGKLSNDNPDVYWTGIAGQDDIYLAHTDMRQVVAAEKMTPVVSAEFGALLQPGEAFDILGDTLYIVMPIVENNISVGKLKVAASTREIVAARNSSILTVVSITVLMMVPGIPLTLILLHRKLRPITEITGHLKRVNFDNISFDIPVQRRNEFGYLAETLRVMGSKLNAARQELIEKERIARELEIAREIQASILPRDYPRSPQFEFSGSYRSAREVGGDYYDFLDVDDRYLGFLVADVSGKSLPGMLVMLLTRDIVKRIARTTPDPAQLLMQVNRELLPNIKKGMFVTMFVGVVDKHAGVFSFASAGHNPLIRIHGPTGIPELVKTRGFPLGLMPPEQFDGRIEAGRIDLSAEDWLVQYTDGINEAKNNADEEFGMDRFVDNILACRHMTPAALVHKVIARHAEFVGGAPQFDDITLLAMKWRGKSTTATEVITREGINAGSK